MGLEKKIKNIIKLVFSDNEKTKQLVSGPVLPLCFSERYVSLEYISI